MKDFLLCAGLLLIVGVIQGCTAGAEGGVAPSSENSVVESPSETPSPVEDPVVTGAIDLNSGVALGWKKADGTPTKITFTKTTGALKYECRTAQIALVSSGTFTNCDGTADGRAGFALLTEPASASRSARYQTDVRTTASDGSVSTANYTWYAHETLTSLSECTEVATDDDFFTKAKEVLTTTQNFGGSGTRIEAGKLSLPFQSGSVSLLSLRKFFKLSVDRKLLIIRRKYPSRFSASCELTIHTGIKRNAQPGEEVSMSYCDAIVANANGQAVCIKKESGALAIKRAIGNLQRKYAESGASHTITRNNVHFSPKTTDSNYTTDTTGLGTNRLLYMPD